jgi:diaminohydroxyphosphoribosylaminopyrimidine deaminase / 5-amino-6-(5-phosphoribosylamino)uracil reductase
LIGLNAVLNDNPQLTARNWHGKNPIRIVIDKNLEIPLTYKVFDKSAKTLVINNLKNECSENIHFIKTEFDENTLKNIFDILYKLKIQSVVVEGGAITLNNFINRGYWDEARVFIGDKFFEKGVKAPDFNYPILQSFIYDDSILNIYKNPNNEF